MDKEQKEEQQRMFDEWQKEAYERSSERINKIIAAATNKKGDLAGAKEEEIGRLDTYRLNVYLPWTWGIVLETYCEAHRTTKKETTMRGLHYILFPEHERPAFIIPTEITDQIREGFQMIEENLEGLEITKKTKDLIDNTEMIKDLIDTREAKYEAIEELYIEKMKRHIIQELIKAGGRMEIEEVKHKVKTTYYYESELTPELYFRPEIFERVLEEYDLQIVLQDEVSHQSYLYLEAEAKQDKIYLEHFQPLFLQAISLHRLSK